MSKYIHTIDGKPATFDGYQICYSTYYGKPNVMRDSLAEIKRDREISRRNRERDGYPIKLKYGHFRYA